MFKSIDGFAAAKLNSAKPGHLSKTTHLTTRRNGQLQLACNPQVHPQRVVILTPDWDLTPTCKKCRTVTRWDALAE